MTYQDRKDIDSLIKVVDELKYIVGYDENSSLATSDDIKSLKKELNKYYDSSDVELVYEEFVSSLTKLDTSLRNLLSDLDEFNYALFYLDENNIGLETDLTELKDNLMILLGMLDEFDNHLIGFQSILDAFDLQLNGDETHDGFVDTLQAIQRAIGTENDPQSLKGMLHDFGEALQDIADGDNKLALTLSTLSGYFVAFQGTLREFQQQIEEDLGTATYQAMDAQVINLIYQIANANQELEDHKDSLDDMTDMIGTDSDTLADGTVFGILNNTSDVADEGLRVAGEVSDAIEDEINPALYQINQQDIPNIKDKMGYNSVPQGQSIQSQITAQGNTIGSSSDSASSNTLFGKVKNAQNTADAVDDRVGTSTSTSESTVFGSLNRTINSVGAVQNALGDVSQLSTTVVNEINENIDNIEEVQNGMYKGTGANYNPNATIDNPSNGTFIKVINAQVDEAQSTATEAKSDASTAQGTADSAYSLAGGADSKATTAQTTANRAEGKADTAQSTADTAQSTADDAYDLADEAKSDASTAQGTANDAYTLADGADTKATTAQGTANDAYSLADGANTKIGNVDVSTDGTIATQLFNAKSRLALHNANISQLIDPSSSVLLVMLVDEMFDVVQINTYLNGLRSHYLTTYGVELNYVHDINPYRQADYYKRDNSGNWSAYSMPSTTPIIRIIDRFPSETISSEGLFLFNIDTNKYYKLVRKQISSIWTYEWEECNSVIDFLDKTVLYDAIDNSFAHKSHTHTASDLPSSMPPSSHTHGNLQNDGKVGTSNNTSKNVVTDANGFITTEAKPVIPTVPSASTTTPSADTQYGSYGNSSDYARANHTHPKSTLYASATHTHTASDLPSTMPPSSHDHGNLQNDGTIKTNAVVTDSNLNGMVVTDSSGRVYIRNVLPVKLVPSFTLKQTINDVDGGVAKVYTDGLYVLVTFDGNFTKKKDGTAIGGNGNSIIATINNTDCRPSTYITVPATTSYNNNSKIAIHSNGDIYIINATSSSTVQCRTEVMYPVASRLPS